MNLDSIKLLQDSLFALQHDSSKVFIYLNKYLPQICEQLSTVKPLIICLIILLLFDFITGTRKAKALKIAITSNGFRRTIAKFNDYSIAILASQVFTWLFALDISLSYYAALYICGIELKSIYENVSQTTGVNLIGYLKGFIPDAKKMFTKKSEPEKTDSDKE